MTRTPFTARSSAPAFKRAVFIARIVTGVFVFGFKPHRAGRAATANTPLPTSDTSLFPPQPSLDRRQHRIRSTFGRGPGGRCAQLWLHRYDSWSWVRG